MKTLKKKDDKAGAIVCALLTFLFVLLSVGIQACKSDDKVRTETPENNKKEEIRNLVSSWAKAWQEAPFNIEPYKALYHTSFRADYKSSSGMDYVQWIADKMDKAKRAKCIEIYVSNLDVEFRDDLAIATFMQRYVSKIYCDTGVKKLYFKKFDEGWKIIGEEQPNTSKCNDRCR